MIIRYLRKFKLSFFLIFYFGSVAFLYKTLFLLNWFEPSQRKAFFISLGIAYDLYVVCLITFCILILLYIIPKWIVFILIIIQTAWILFNFLIMPTF